jgi:hypothetical protein
VNCGVSPAGRMSMLGPIEIHGATGTASIGAGQDLRRLLTHKV